jgi:hypothetical protein
MLDAATAMSVAIGRARLDSGSGAMPLYPGKSAISGKTSIVFPMRQLTALRLLGVKRHLSAIFTDFRFWYKVGFWREAADRRPLDLRGFDVPPLR